MQLFSYKATEAGAQRIAKGGHVYAQRKAAESRRAAMDEARIAIAKAERAAFDSKARSQLARLFEEAANRVERRRGGVISFRTIERRICRVFKVSPEMLRSRAGRVEYATARMALMYWARRLTKLSSTELGLRCGRDHSTVRHGVDKYVTKRARQGRTLRRLPKAIFSGRSWANGIRTTGKDTHE